jgi:phage baseplate assembly protein W
MAIKVTNLKKISDTFTNKNHVYKDITFDVSLFSYEPLGYKTSMPGKDIKVSYDAKAVSNSLLNLFNTRPGQRFLFPEFGVNLLPFVFTQITAENGDIIGSTIMAAIKKFEPRVKTTQLLIDADPDNNQYTFNIYYEIPMLGETFTSKYQVNAKEQTFISLSTERT